MKNKLITLLSESNDVNFQRLYDMLYDVDIPVDRFRVDLINLCIKDCSFGFLLAQHFEKPSAQYDFIRRVSCSKIDANTFDLKIEDESFFEWVELCEQKDLTSLYESDFFFDYIRNHDDSSYMALQVAKVVGPWVDLCEMIDSIGDAVAWVSDIVCLEHHYQILLDNVVSTYDVETIESSEWNDHVPDSFKVTM